MKKLIVGLLLIFGYSSTLEAVDGTVVAIHGFLVPQRSMHPLRKTLQYAGFDTLLWDYDSPRATVCCHAMDLVSTLQNIAKQKPGQPIHFVTHSIGAWVLRCALNQSHCPPEAKIGRAVLIAPPNQGSIMARRFGNLFLFRFILGNESGRELRTYKAEDVALCLGYFPSTVQVLVLAGSQGIHWFRSPNDEFLEVCETVLETPHTFRVLPLTHGKLLSNCCSLQMTRNFLLCGDV